MSVETLSQVEQKGTESQLYEDTRNEILAIADRLHDDGDLGNIFRGAMGVVRTPLSESRDEHWDLGKNRLFLKDETRQKTSAYKVRGAASSVMLAQESNPSLRQITCGSAGNFALGVAHASRVLGLEAHVYMRDGASAVKLAKLQKLHAFLHNHYPSLADAISAATVAGDEHPDSHFAHPYDSPEVIAGQSTVMHEILHDRMLARSVDWQKELIEIVVPGGGKGLAAGTVLELDRAKDRGLIGNNVRMRVVEIQDTGENGEILSKENLGWCDGTATADGTLGAMVLRECSTETSIEVVSPLEVSLAMSGLERSLKNRVEPAGALATAGIRKIISTRADDRPTTFISVVSGGNASRDTIYEAMRLQGKVYNYRNSLLSMRRES